jgi:hypothetical protein
MLFFKRLFLFLILFTSKGDSKGKTSEELRKEEKRIKQ